MGGKHGGRGLEFCIGAAGGAVDSTVFIEQCGQHQAARTNLISVCVTCLRDTLAGFVKI